MCIFVLQVHKHIHVNTDPCKRLSISVSVSQGHTDLMMSAKNTTYSMQSAYYLYMVRLTSAHDYDARAPCTAKDGEAPNPT